MTQDDRTSLADFDTEQGLHAGGDTSPEERLSLLELLDRVLDKGVTLSGDITLSVADVDLVYVGLRVLISSIEAAQRRRSGEGDSELFPGPTDAPK